jgi:hypothetical protein
VSTALFQALKTSGNHKLREDEFPPTLDTYVQRGEDLFGYEEHFGRWHTSKTTYRIIMAR